jgi:hypothetical protein
LARQAQAKESDWKPFDKEIVINGKPVRVIGSEDQFGQFKDLSNNIYSSVFDAFSPQIPPPDGVPITGLPLGGNSATPLNSGVPPENTQPNNVPSPTPGQQALADRNGASVANEVPVVLPPGSSFVTPKEGKPTKEAIVVSGNEAEALGLDPTGTYEVTYENGKAVRYNPITAPSTEIGRAQLSKLEAESKEAKDKIEKAQRARDIALKTMSDYVTDKGEPTKRLNDAVGYGEAVATTIAEYAPIFGTQSPESRSDQQRLARLIEGEILEAASLLKPVSNTDLLMLKNNRPQTTSPPEVWAKYFSDIKTILSNPENYIGSVPTPKTEAAKESATPKTATDRLRAIQK